MASARFEIEKFTDKTDFGLWKIKMKTLLLQQGLWEALQPRKEPSKAGKEVIDDDLSKIEEKAHSTIILSLGDKALREVAKEKTAREVWERLDSLYMVKTLANMLYMKHKLYSFKMFDEKHILPQVDEFNEVVDDLENIEVKIATEDKTLILLYALPKSFENFKDTILFGNRNSISLEEVVLATKCGSGCSVDKSPGVT